MWWSLFDLFIEYNAKNQNVDSHAGIQNNKDILLSSWAGHETCTHFSFLNLVNENTCLSVNLPTNQVRPRMREKRIVFRRLGIILCFWFSACLDSTSGKGLPQNSLLLNCVKICIIQSNFISPLGIGSARMINYHSLSCDY
jgi:hypothetical protein